MENYVEVVGTVDRGITFPPSMAAIYLFFFGSMPLVDEKLRIIYSQD